MTATQASQVSTPRSSQWGMSTVAYQAHVAEFGPSSDSQSPMRKYIDQRKNAQRRGVAWEFNFSDWWQVWTGSGKWSQRARSNGYVMARHGDGDTPYSKETVYICTAVQNVRDSFVNVPASTRDKTNTSRPSKSKGTGRGWTYKADCKNNPYHVMFNKKVVGYYPTAELARAAYLAAYEKSKGSK